jgi:hypothetical protein
MDPLAGDCGHRLLHAGHRGDWGLRQASVGHHQWERGIHQAPWEADRLPATQDGIGWFDEHSIRRHEPARPTSEASQGMPPSNQRCCGIPVASRLKLDWLAPDGGRRRFCFLKSIPLSDHRNLPP